MIFGAISAVSTPLAIYFGIQTYRLKKFDAARARPYVEPELRQGDCVTLKGEGADKWMITEIEIVSPPDAQFMRLVPQPTGDHTYCPPITEPMGRRLADPNQFLIVSSSESAVSISVLARLKSEPRYQMRSSARVILNDA